MDSLVEILLGKPFRYVLSHWNTCPKRRRNREEMEGSNPEPTPIQESSGSSSMRSSKIRPCYVEYNYGASSSAANNPFVRKKIKMSFNEMMFMSQEKNSSSTADSSGKAYPFQPRKSASLKFFPPNENNLESNPFARPSSSLIRPSIHDQEAPQSQNINLFNLEQSSSQIWNPMDTKPAGSGEKEDPILISDYEEGFSDQSQLENLLKQLDSITRDISDLTIESPDHQKIYREESAEVKREDSKDAKKPTKTSQDVQNTREYREYEQEIKDFWYSKSKLNEIQNFPEITFEEYRLVNRIWNEKKILAAEVVKHKHIAQVLSYKNLQTLTDMTWLNDEVINAYIELMMIRDQYLKNRILIFNTFTFPMIQDCVRDKNFTKVFRIIKKKNINPLECSQIFVPINLVKKKHWTYIRVDMEKRQIFYHDSLNHNKGEAVDAMSCVSALIEAVILSEFGTGLNLKDLTIGNYCVPLDRLGKFELIDYVDNPKQDNGSDCGVFTVKGIDYYTRKLVPNFGPDDIPYFRRLICLELCDGRLRVPKWMT